MAQHDGDQLDLLSEVSELDSVRHLLADLHDDLPTRFRMLTDLGSEMGRFGSMIFGYAAGWHAWVEARSSFCTAILSPRCCYAKASSSSC